MLAARPVSSAGQSRRLIISRSRVQVLHGAPLHRPAGRAARHGAAPAKGPPVTSRRARTTAAVALAVAATTVAGLVGWRTATQAAVDRHLDAGFDGLSWL